MGVKLADFEIGRRLGEGAFGDVHAAFDKSRGANVALKRLRQSGAGSLYRFKNEFRGLAGIFHPNLVNLHDLFTDNGEWYIAMELVHGTTIVEYVRRALFAFADTVMTEAVVDLDDLPTLPRVAVQAFDLSRVRSAFTQLTAGVRALHEAQRIHRDLKPSNVLVARDGTVKILDFGLVTELVDGSRSLADIVGTPAYMAPEQARGEDVTEASDWYAVGVMLYESLVGRPPFDDGDALEVIAAKNMREASDPRSVSAALPPVLCDLCMRLLRRDPSSRPPPDQIERALDAIPGPISRISSPVPRAPLVGRDDASEALLAAFETARTGLSVTAHVVGASGNGKSALLRDFLGRISAPGDVVALEGRCYEGEAAPFKAVDTVMSAAAARLKRFSPAALDAVLPRDFDLLTQLFPVLHRLNVPSRSTPPFRDALDALEIRRRGFAALRDLIGRLAERHPVVIAIDDFQWGDVDSVELLAELVRAPDAPPVLVVLSYRSEGAETNETILALKERVLGGHAVAIDVAPLERAMCAELARALLEPSGTAAEGDIDAIATESRGSPLFVHELARHVTQGAGGTDEVSLDALISERLSCLSEDARTVIQIVALAASGVSVDVLAAIARLPGELALSALTALRGARFLRMRRDAVGDVVEVYHDRIRERVRALIEPALAKQLHGRIAEALEHRDDVDPEVIVFHFRASEHPEAALPHAERAAAAASRALAFDRAARIHAVIVELTPAHAETRVDVRIAWADALVRTGRGGEAAALYEECAREVKGERGVELWRRASEQLLLVGEVNRGRSILNRVLESSGLALAGPWKTLLTLMMLRAWIRLRGLERRRVRSAKEKERLTLRLEACNSAALGLVMIDNVQSTLFITRLLLAAIKLDNPLHRSRALVGEAICQSYAGNRARARMLRDAGAKLAREIESPYCLAFADLGSGILAIGEGQWADGIASFERAAANCRAQPSPLSTTLRETHLCELMSHMAEIYSGQFVAADARRKRLLRDANDRGNIFLRITSEIGFATLIDLAQGDVASAYSAVAYANARWPELPYTQQRLFALVGTVLTDMYEKRALAASQRIDDEWALVAAAGWLHAATYCTMTRYLRGASHLAACAADRAFHLRVAKREARALARRREPWTRAFGAVLSGVVAGIEGRHAEARRLLLAAAADFASYGMRAYEAAARHRVGLLLGGEEGTMMRRAALRQIEALGVRNAYRFVAVLVPAPTVA